ncbi:hypothetical protein QQ008_06640 [Fulvivirgaceae bacterium BMA10]|uniref:Uncharacterized protein n=1 Tax=Splendidivirga corallicola TaxID=3051826 RepID=A0ABT8KKR0_9BACT|nr:hypothetical protein [Fulvivirgaceae bacterium BMA10]
MSITVFTRVRERGLRLRRADLKIIGSSVAMSAYNKGVKPDRIREKQPFGTFMVNSYPDDMIKSMDIIINRYMKKKQAEKPRPKRKRIIRRREN